MRVDRTAIPEMYDVLTASPTAQATERLMWTTNIFISANLTEARTSLVDYPCFDITYNFNLRCISHDFLRATANSKKQWIIPWFPYLTTGSVSSGTYSIDNAGSLEMPYHEYMCLVSSTALIYAGVNNRTASWDKDPEALEELGDIFYAVPCFKAYVEGAIRYSDHGQYVDGSTASINWKITDGDEVNMVNLQGTAPTTFDYRERLQRQVQGHALVKQARFNKQPARAHAFSPNAFKPDQLPILSSVYRFHHNPTDKPVMGFRDWFNYGKGSYTAGLFVDETQLYRLQDDTIMYQYTPGMCDAQVNIRGVTA